MCMFIVCVNGHRKQQTELYREPTNTVSFSNFIDPRLTYNKRCMAVLTGALRTVNTIAQFYKDFTSYLTSLGAPPLANGREVPQAPQSIRGHPEPLQTIYAIKQLVILLEVTQHLKEHLSSGKQQKHLIIPPRVTQHLKTLGLGKSPSRPPEQSHVQSVSRQGRPKLYQTISTRYCASGSIHTRKLHYKTLQTSSTK